MKKWLIKIFKGILGLPELVGLKGTLIARKRLVDGSWVMLWEKEIHNLITFAGVAQAALVLYDNTADHFRYGEIGSNSTAPVDGDNGCKTALSRVLATMSRVTTTITNDTAQWISQHTASGAWSVYEYALMTLAAAGTGLNRVTFGLISLANGEMLEFTYKCQVTRV
jgi:hypothetical protein